MTNRERFTAAGVVSVIVFILYVITLSPAVAMWDAGEYIAAAKSIGIPHQPGNPMYLLIAHLAGMLPVSPDYAVRINLLAAFCSALTAGLWFLCAERVLRDSVSGTWSRIGASATAALLGATAFTVWNQSVVMEKVYPLALVGLALISWLMLKWFDEEGRKADRLLVLMLYAMGVTYAIHPAGLLPMAAVGIAVLATRPRTITRVGLIAVSAGAFVFGASSFAVLPIRAAYDPYVNESAVSACEDGRLEAGCTFSSETARRLVGTIQREQYGGNPVMERRAPFSAQLAQYWMYFKWQWFRDINGQHSLTQSLVAATMLVLGLFGLWSLRPNAQAGAASRAPYFWYFAPLAFTFTLLLIFYLNFRYSAGQSPELGNTVPREPRERDYFYMWTFSLWGLLAGLGVASLWRRKTAAMVALAVIPLAANFDAASRTGQSFTRAWAVDMLNSVEPNGVLITNGDNDSFPLWYAQEVEGIRRDVTVTLTPYLGMEWYARQLNRRHGIWKLSDAELDTVPPYIENATPVLFEHGDIRATINERYLTRDQLLVLRAIKDSFPNRGIYFSFGPYAQQMGLGPYIKRVGLVQKLESRPVREDADSVALLEGLYIDIPRSLALWKKYQAPAQVLREGKWVDVPSSDVPLYYAVVGRDLAIALDARGRKAEADTVIETARRVAEIVESSRRAAETQR
jgi:hypothetical protein